MSDVLNRLILEFAKLPGIGEKTAMRLAYYVLRADEESVRALSEALIDAKKKIRLCEECFTFTENTVCSICSSFSRKKEFICVVEKPSDSQAIENSGKFEGVYHVLHGVLSPLDGIGPNQLKIKELIARISKNNVQEVVLALNPSVEGEATTVYLTKLLLPLGVKVSQIAQGIQVGGVLEYTDRQTLGRAIENRVTIETI
jgi:recombination protein RecR